MAQTFWGRFTDDRSRMRDGAEMAQRTKICTFVGSGISAIRDVESGDLDVMRMNEQDKPERVASFHGNAFNGEAFDDGEGQTELAIFHNSGAPIATAMTGDRKPARDAAARPGKVSNLVRAPAKSPTRDMARHKDTSPVLAMQARNLALRSTRSCEARR
jgi:hypothetical protein